MTDAHSAFLDAAYARMPFATCWLVFRLPVPTARQLLRYRGEFAARESAANGALPRLAEAMRSLLSATEHWATPPLDYYPAFAAQRARSVATPSPSSSSQ